MKRLVTAAAAVLVLACRRRAGGGDGVAAHGFSIRHVVEVAAPPARVWDALIQPGRWWDPAHTWSGEARNLRIEPRPGGCFCEDLPDGGVRHMASST